MSAARSFVATRCAICDTLDNADELYPARFDDSALNPTVFSARRLPDRIHYRLARCRGCGLVRSDPVVDAATLHDLYARSTFDYSNEVGGLRVTYSRSLARLSRFGARTEALLEIGGGNGFFLEEAVKQGYGVVQGIEPSQAAIDRANPAIKPHLLCDIIRPGLFPHGSFDVICIFHVFDHLPNPGSVLDECRQLLRPGGLILCVCHDVEAPSARLLRERSPIVDIEHTFLYSPRTATRILRDRGYAVLSVSPLWNVYPTSYVARLLPLPVALKRSLLAVLRWTRLNNIHVALPLGNLEVVAQKPLEAGAGSSHD